jgi:peptide/nickel transport system ATP-binding protein
MPDALLDIRDLEIRYAGLALGAGTVDLKVRDNEIFGLVGESGSGKTTLSRCLIGLHEQRSGEIAFHGTPLAPTARRRDAEVRRAMQYVFQNPYASLHPRRTVGASVAQPLEHFFGLKGRPAQERVGAALERVALPGALAARFPGELSGGERQRAAIARALVCEPELLICDEVTSALDVSVQAAIVELLQQLREEGRLSMLFVTHNLALVRTLADRVAVLRDGRLVEVDVTDAVLDRPQDPYTRELLADTPRLVAAGA